MESDQDMTLISNEVHVAKGMPSLDMSGKPTSFFEFWPAWVMYFPVLLQSLLLAIRHGSLTLPLIANPRLRLSGMVGVGKSELMSQAEGECHETILSWFDVVVSSNSIERQAREVEDRMAAENLSYPIVCKPDIGCRGVGVKLVSNAEELATVLLAYPIDSRVIVQKLSDWEPEAGVFYVRQPGEVGGSIISMALKYMPYVVGNGELTLRQLIERDPRAGELKHLYLQRHHSELDRVIGRGESYRLIFAASHSRGAIFRDANEHITPALSKRIDQLMQQLPEFYYGRLDIKFRDLDALKAGQDLQIVEINCASAESLHIWDRRANLRQAVGALLYQYRLLFKLGVMNRKKGYRPPSLRELLVAWQQERRLTSHYPETD